jgi:hypothetical protein
MRHVKRDLDSCLGAEFLLGTKQQSTFGGLETEGETGSFDSQKPRDQKRMANGATPTQGERAEKVNSSESPKNF